MSKNEISGPTGKNPVVTEDKEQPKESTGKSEKEKPAGSPKTEEVVSKLHTTNAKDEAWVQQTENEVNNFVSAMKVARTSEQFYSAHITFYKELRNILKSRSQELFNRRWNKVLEVARREADTVFNFYVIYKGGDAWAAGQLDYTIYKRMCLLILNTCDPAIRERKLKSMVMEKVTVGLSGGEKNRLAAYYMV